MPQTLPVSYSSVSHVYTTLPDLGSATSLSSAHVFEFLGKAESVINAKIARMYSLPLPSVPPLLTALSTDIAIYFILSQRMFTAERLNQSPWPDRYREALATLDQVARGDLLLVDSAGALIGGRTDVAEVWSTTKGYEQTFWEGSWSLQVQDPDKLEDEGDRRDLGGLRRRLE